MVDAISGQPGVEEDISSHDFIEASKAEANSPIHFEDAYRNWFEYSYGAIDDYRSGVGTIRATKYALDKKLGFYNLIEEKGA